MKKLILIMMVCLLLCGCGSKKKNKSNKIDVPDNVSEEIKNSDIGSKDVTYYLDVNCGDKTAQSKVFLGADGSAYYNLYECSSLNLHLITSNGTYTFDEDVVILKDDYQKEWEIAVSDDEIKLKWNDNVLTFTK